MLGFTTNLFRFLGQPHIDEEEIEEDFHKRAGHPKATRVFVWRNKNKKFRNSVP